MDGDELREFMAALPAEDELVPMLMAISEQLPSRMSLVVGIMSGLVMANRNPMLAGELRHRLEREFADELGVTAEQVEVMLRP